MLIWSQNKAKSAINIIPDADKKIKENRVFDPTLSINQDTNRGVSKYEDASDMTTQAPPVVNDVKDVVNRKIEYLCNRLDTENDLETFDKLLATIKKAVAFVQSN